MIRNAPPWPNGARCAVAFSFDMDADSVVHASHRDPAPDEVHAIAQMRYDPLVGMPRIVDLFGGYRIPITCFVPGWVIEAYPQAVAHILTHDNEIAHHGHFHEWPSKQSEAEERRTLERGSRLIERLTGRPPRGYRAPYYGLSRRSFDLLIEAGFLYNSSLFADDIPILLDNGKGTLVELPVPASVDDYNQYVSSRAFDYLMKISPPRHALEVYRAEFNAMWEFSGMWIAVWHPAVSGRPAPVLAIRDLIEHMLAKGQVWFATQEQIAAHVRALIAEGRWTPRSETIPFYTAPVLPSAPSA